MPGNLKLLKRLRNKMEERRGAVIRLQKSFGFDRREGGNHTVFTYQEVMIPIPHDKRLGPRYVETVVKRLDEIISNEKGGRDAGN